MKTIRNHVRGPHRRLRGSREGLREGAEGAHRLLLAHQGGQEEGGQSVGVPLKMGIGRFWPLCLCEWQESSILVQGFVSTLSICVHFPACTTSWTPCTTSSRARSSPSWRSSRSTRGSSASRQGFLFYNCTNLIEIVIHAKPFKFDRAISTC